MKTAQDSSRQCVKAEHNHSEKIGQGQIGVNDQSPGLVTEFFRNVTGLLQDIELNKTEEELQEDLKILTARRMARSGSGR